MNRFTVTAIASLVLGLATFSSHAEKAKADTPAVKPATKVVMPPQASNPEVAKLVKAADATWMSLDPVGGAIPVPKGWVIKEQHEDAMYAWTIRDPKLDVDGAWAAREKVVLMPGVSKSEKKRASAWATAQVSLIQRGKQGVRSCGSTTVGPFTRICVDFENQWGDAKSPVYLVRSMFYYADSMDLAAMASFSVQKSMVEKFVPAMSAMEQLQFFDMDAGKKAAEIKSKK
jgi:hypothetical protein